MTPVVFIAEGGFYASEFHAECPYPCVCEGLTVSCANKDLTDVPVNIPPETQRLDLQENRIAVIRKSDFMNLKNLKILQLMENHIHTVEPDAFNDLIELERM
ncbi:unnamed protein product [Soboliphyme baturini]|uniref:LRRNT domain-containing protein n=1 Tax=Soboliphyme baturini TaxID=241478 RepID=A0A183IW22_9BILA|nr:unnamed protein product [Soboliphyme baturini]